MEFRSTLGLYQLPTFNNDVIEQYKQLLAITCANFKKSFTLKPSGSFKNNEMIKLQVQSYSFLRGFGLKPSLS